jgi:hypothetical protein
MANLENLTRFTPVDLHSITKEGKDILVICVAGQFDLPAPGKPSQEPPFPSEVQLPTQIEDIYWGEPGISSLKYEGQTAYHRPGTDIYLIGSARSPDGKPVRKMRVMLRVGSCQKQAFVVGDRKWMRGILGLKPSSPSPFVSMPLQYERSFGGVAQARGNKAPEYEPRNPVGCGFYGTQREAINNSLPNIEDPSDLINNWSDHPSPVGFGPIARNWQPRLEYAGTYDEAWVEHRAPLWPLDFDARFFQAASQGLVATPWLEGTEPVTLVGFSHESAISFPLPSYRLMAKSYFRDRVDRRLMVMDAIQIEPDKGIITLIWRTAIPVHRQLPDHEYTLVRELEPWEDVKL